MWICCAILLYCVGKSVAKENKSGQYAFLSYPVFFTGWIILHIVFLQHLHARAASAQLVESFKRVLFSSRVPN